MVTDSKFHSIEKISWRRGFGGAARYLPTSASSLDTHDNDLISTFSL